jgi:hypothetical protein
MEINFRSFGNKDFLKSCNSNSILPMITIYQQKRFILKKIVLIKKCQSVQHEGTHSHSQVWVLSRFEPRYPDVVREYPSTHHSWMMYSRINIITVSLGKFLFPSGLTCPDFTSWPLMGARFQTFHWHLS